MAIVFACPCGRQFRARSGSGGRVFTCPDCRVAITVPADDAVDLGIAVKDEPINSTPRAVGPQRVVVVDVQMRFTSMVVFMVKWAIASIPAFLILWLLSAAFFLCLYLLALAFMPRT